jgi:hypothetical protein
MLFRNKPKSLFWGFRNIGDRCKGEWQLCLGIQATIDHFNDSILVDINPKDKPNIAIAIEILTVSAGNIEKTELAFVNSNVETTSYTGFCVFRKR